MSTGGAAVGLAGASVGLTGASVALGGEGGAGGGEAGGIAGEGWGAGSWSVMGGTGAAALGSSTTVFFFTGGLDCLVFPVVVPELVLVFVLLFRVVVPGFAAGLGRTSEITRSSTLVFLQRPSLLGR